MSPATPATLATLAVPLSHWGVIRATGTEASQFLHGQLTQDVLSLGPAEARLAGYCSSKGRLLASFVVWKPRDGEVLLACHASVLPATLKRLSMFVMRAKCQLKDASADVALIGVSGERAHRSTEGLPVWGLRADVDSTWIRLPDVAGIARAWQVSRTEALHTLQPLALAAWRQLEVDSGIVTIEAATMDQFVPQMLNFELIGAVNFLKGCYPGQVVDDRAAYRGTIKRRTFLFVADAPIAAGQEVFHSVDPTQPAGLVASAAPALSEEGKPVTSHALIEVKLAALEGGSLHLGAPDGALLASGTMPYEVLRTEIS